MAALWSLVAVGIFAAIAVVANSEVGPGFALVALLGWVVFLPLTRPVKGVRRLLDVAFLAGVVYFLTFGVRSVLLLLRTQPELPVSVGDPSVAAVLAGFQPIHFEALVLATVCWIAFTIAYRSPAGPALAARIGDPGLGRLGTGRLLFFIAALAGVGWGARIAFRSAFAGFGHIDPTVLAAGDFFPTWLKVFAPAALVLALLGVVWFRRHPTFIILAAGLTLGEIGFALFVGQRTTLFSAAFALAAFGALQIKRPGRWLVVILPIALVVFGATAVYRNPTVFSSTRADDALSRFATTLDQSIELGPLGLAEIGLWNVSARYIGVESVAQVLLIGPPEPTWGERYLLAAPSSLIPRFLWSDKQTTDYVFDFARTYHGVPNSVVVPYAPTWVADLMLSFPLLIVPLGMVVMGWACRVLNDYGWRAQARRSFGLVPYALLLPVVVQADAWISAIIYDSVQIMAVTFGVALLLGIGALQPSSASRAKLGGVVARQAMTRVERGPAARGAPEADC